jgi:hypothetical protein
MISTGYVHIIDSKHGLCLVAGDVHDGNVYHQLPEGRANAEWLLEPVSPDVYRIKDRKHGKYLIGGEPYDGRLHHYPHDDRADARWRLIRIAEQGREVYQLREERWNREIATGDSADSNVYHQVASNRANARFILVDPADMNKVQWNDLREVHSEISNTSGNYHLSFRSESEAAAAGHSREQVAFVAYATPQPGTVPIYRERVTSSGVPMFHFWNRSGPQDTFWERLEVAFYAFPTQVPGTVPVYREEKIGSFNLYHYSTRGYGTAARAGWQSGPVAFYAYPADKLHPFPQIALRAYNGQFLNVGIDGKTITADRDAVGGWETFERIPLGQGLIALRAANGLYVCAENGGGGPVVANRVAIGEWETFREQDLGTGGIALQAHNGKWVCAENAGGQPLVANRDQALGWETFAMVQNPAAFACETVSGNLVNIECGGDGSVWGINVNRAIFRRDGDA